MTLTENVPSPSRQSQANNDFVLDEKNWSTDHPTCTDIWTVMSNALSVFLWRTSPHMLGAGVSYDPNDIGRRSLMGTATETKMELLRKGESVPDLLCILGVSGVRQKCLPLQCVNMNITSHAFYRS